VAGAVVEAWAGDVPAVEQGFERLFREHYQTVYRTAYGVLGRAHDAEDVAQTVFLRVLRATPAREWAKNPGAYLYRAAVNEALNVVRSRKRQVLTDDPERYELPPAGRAPESSDETHRRLYEAVAELSPGAAEIVILRYVHGCSDAEIAKRLGTSRGTIAVSLYRSRARLRRLLSASSSGGRP
jgi:RNA polymerase sigma-70 factor (ECF subfamily)